MAYSFVLASYLISFSLCGCQIIYLLSVLVDIDLHEGNAHHAQSNDDNTFLCRYSHIDKLVLYRSKCPSERRKDHKGKNPRSVVVISDPRDRGALLQKRVSLVLKTTMLPCHLVS
jgi:hypothetical protein